MIETQNRRPTSAETSRPDNFQAVIQDVPSFSKNNDRLLETAQRYAEQNYRDGNFLSDPVSAFFHLAIAERIIHIQDRKLKGLITPEAAISENLVALNMLLLLGGVAHRHYLANRDSISPRLTLSETEIFEAHQDFANPELSRELDDYLSNLKTSMSQDRLPNPEQPYEVIVLNVLSRAGLAAQLPHDPSRLQDNSDRFAAQTRQNGIMGCAWTIRLGNLSLIGIPRDTAESILREQTAKSEEELLHEYYHSQYPVNTAGLGFYMIYAEEMRVKKLSGDTTSYKDVDKFFYSLARLLGTDITLPLKSLSADAGYNFLLQAARSIGTQRTLELALTLPDTYQNGNTTLPIRISEHLGGARGLLERIRKQRL